MATTDNLWVMDPELEDQLTDVLTRINGSGATLRLFENDLTPDPETVLGDLTAPTLDGYADVDLEGDWTSPARDEAGVWSSQTEIHTFTVDPAEEGSTTIYGVGIFVGTELKLAGRFDSPQTWEDGSPLRVRIVYVQYAALTFKAIVLS